MINDGWGKWRESSITRNWTHTSTSVITLISVQSKWKIWLEICFFLERYILQFPSMRICFYLKHASKKVSIILMAITQTACCCHPQWRLIIRSLILKKTLWKKCVLAHFFPPLSVSNIRHLQVTVSALPTYCFASRSKADYFISLTCRSLRI